MGVIIHNAGFSLSAATNTFSGSDESSRLSDGNSSVAIKSYLGRLYMCNLKGSVFGVT